MKTCKGCGIEKENDDFYVLAGNRDGLTGKCRVCIRDGVRKNRADHVDYYREFDRQRSNDENRVAGRIAYNQTERGREVRSVSVKTWIDNNPDKRKAQNAVNNAIRDGRLFRQPCEECGSMKVHGHHADYSKPLEVQWLCAACHTKEHKMIKGAVTC